MHLELSQFFMARTELSVGFLTDFGPWLLADGQSSWKLRYHQYYDSSMGCSDLFKR